MSFSRRFDERAADLLGDLADLHFLGQERIKPACLLFDWYVTPHLGSQSFSYTRRGMGASRGGEHGLPLYLLDDDSAVRVPCDKVDVVSTGAGGWWGLVVPNLPRQSRRTPAVAHGRMAAW